jgi:crotonobetainyl-CoA:carnitine CoA-transferase CaiB-like acyl-CoA transferase
VNQGDPMEPLSFVRVVDLTDLRGALCGRMLADLGADVVKVEGPAVTAASRATNAYRYRNANKRGSFLDPATASGTAGLHALLADADIVIENEPGGPFAVALDAESLIARHPHLVHVALRDFGSFGPRAAWRLEPLTALAASGTMHATGFPTMAPCAIPGYLAHDCASTYGAIGALAALADREHHGHGQVVDVSVQEAALAGTAPWSIAIRDYLRVNPRLNAVGTRNADGAYWVLPASDGWVRSVIGSQRQWDGFVTLLGSPDALLGPEWSAPGFRLMNADVVRIVAADCLTDRTRAEVFAQAMGGGATVGVVHSPSEFVAHEQTRCREFFAATGFDGLGDAPFATVPYKLSVTPASVRRSAPDGAGNATFDARFPGESPNTTTAPRDASRDEAALVFDGLRVIEFGMAAVVPELCGVLSELGAEIIKIESIIHPDVLRSSTGTNINQAFTFNAESRGRASVAIDLTTDEGRDLARALCASADIVAENYRGAVLDDAGLGYDDIRALNPSVIYVASQGYGRGGPYAEMPAYGPLNAGFAGLVHLWSDRNGPYPCGTSLNHPDHIAGKMLAVATLAALAHRNRTGQGQLIDMAQTEAAAYLIGEVYLDAHSRAVGQHVQGNESATDAPHGVYPAAGDDQWLAIAVADDATWQRFESALGWERDPAMALAAQRLDSAVALDARVREWTSVRDPGEAAALLQAHGVSAMPVMGPDDHHADPHLRERKFIVTLHHPEVGIEHHVGNPIRMSHTTQRIAAAAPCLGADTHRVLAEMLDIDPTAVDDLIERGICR